MSEPKCVEQNAGLADRNVMLKMERCAEVLARMIEKYGREVLGRIWVGAEKNKKVILGR